MWSLRPTCLCCSLHLCPRSPGDGDGGRLCCTTEHGARGTCQGSSPTACVDSCCCSSSLSRAATFLLSSLVSVQPRESPLSSLQMLAGGRHAQSPLESGGSHRPVEAPPGLEGELREVRKPGPRPPCFLLAGCHVPTSLGLCPPRRQREAQRDQDLPTSLQPPVSGHWLTPSGCVSLPNGFCQSQRPPCWLEVPGGQTPQESPSVTSRSRRVNARSLAPRRGKLWDMCSALAPVFPGG